MRRASTGRTADESARRRWLAPLAALAAAGLGFAVAYGAGSTIHRTDAAWTDSEIVAGTITTLKVNPVVTMGCANPSGALNLLNPTVPIVWTAPAATSDGVAPTSYVVAWSGAATTPSSAEVAAPATSYSVPVSILTLGAKGTVTVTAKSAGSGWLAASAPSQGFTVTSLALVTSYTCP